MAVTNRNYTRITKELNALTEIAKTINSPLELPELLEAVLKTIIEVLEQSDVGAIMLWDQSAGLFRPAAAVGYDLGVLKEIGLRAGRVNHRQSLRKRPGSLTCFTRRSFGGYGRYAFVQS